ncbi:alpha-ketoglutarate-dependent dioxygenase alkB homolog 7, mitochondrial-like [Babylonia areolata]|uniref:alpha-ketoglutarate-dependent dioxygenase alkB homolog 7, mitochondrial-like n=1 Tax=Babylonia areolata TaxID=304850 RepID=UPI003FD4E80D
MNVVKRALWLATQVPKHGTKLCSASSPENKKSSACTTCAATSRYYTTQFPSDNVATSPDRWKEYLTATDMDTEAILGKDMLVYPDFLSEEEEQSLLAEVDPYMKRLRYEFDHWDNAIHGYRETEKLKWNESNQRILQCVRELAFPPTVPQIAYVHVLDISKDGYIKPHVDAVRFCGNTIAGLCLLSSCVMRLALETDSSRYGDVFLNQRSLYIMRHRARYEYTHEVLAADISKFKGQVVPRDRRISVICRNEPEKQD